MWEKFFQLIEELFGGSQYEVPVSLPTPPVMLQNAPEPTQPSQPIKDLLTTFCYAIKTREGANPVNNNPGNAKYFYGGYLPIYGNVKRSPGGFAMFPTYQQGWLYLQNTVKGIIKAHPGLTFLGFFEIYAPPSDGNLTENYAQQVATACGQLVSNRVDVILS